MTIKRYEIGIKEELSNIIKNEVDKTLNKLYNKRKEREGLVSLQNMLINNLRTVIKDWHEENIRDSMRTTKFLKRMKNE